MILTETKISFLPPAPGLMLYGIYHHHDYGGSLHLVWSNHHPTESEVVTACDIEFEPEYGQWIVIKPVHGAGIITNG